MHLFYFGFALAIYYALHSLLAAPAVKERLAGNLVPAPYYRLVYNVLALVLLLPLAFLYFGLEKKAVLNSALFFTVPGWGFILAGLVWTGRSLAAYDLGEFAGLSQYRTKKPATKPGIGGNGLPGGTQKATGLKTTGLNSQVRHPLYFGNLLVIWGWFLISPNDVVLVAAAVTTVYLFIGARLEERKLVAEFGEAYIVYKRKVPMLIPFRFKLGD
jgi:protein-S-isoprenylcysteine O-methyltransferase Ste14